MASASSEPVSSVSAQRKNNSCPGCTTTPVKIFVKTCRLAAAFPSNGAELALEIREVKFSELKLIHVDAENELVIGEELTA